MPGKYSSADLAESGGAGPAPPVPGKRTLVETRDYGDLDEARPPVQRHATCGSAIPPRLAQNAAAEGVASAGTPLPHAEVIQRAFGRHDVSNVRAQVGGPARTAAQAMGANAYATGDRVAFEAPPDLHLAAHEAAHVVQQRHGRVPAGGLDTPGDSHEQHADNVADAVVAGRSAEGLLDDIATGGTSATGSVQRKADAPRTPETTRVILENYLNIFSRDALRAMGDHLLAMRLPTPHPRLTWNDHHSFVVEVLESIEVSLNFVPLSGVDEILYPSNAMKTLGPLLPETKVWSLEIGLAFAHAIHLALVSSIKRLAPRYLEVADAKGRAGEDAVEAKHLVRSIPIDRNVAKALCARGVVTVEPLSATVATGAPGKHIGTRTIRDLKYEGARDRALWNWVRVVDPPDATAETLP